MLLHLFHDAATSSFPRCSAEVSERKKGLSQHKGLCWASGEPLFHALMRLLGRDARTTVCEVTVVHYLGHGFWKRWARALQKAGATSPGVSDNFPP